VPREGPSRVGSRGRGLVIPFLVNTVCIYQFSLQERSSQVRLMAKIFATAVKVIACCVTSR
jgi:Heterokaryon incompatibility protein (HET)